jgi:hypothetical protein
MLSNPVRPDFALAVSLIGHACATYSSASQCNPLILSRPEDSLYGQPSLSIFAGKFFLPEEKTPSYHIGNQSVFILVLRTGNRQEYLLILKFLTLDKNVLQ